MCGYRKCYEDNLKMKLTLEEKEKCFQIIMKYLTTACRGEGKSHCEIRDLVAVEFSAQCKITIDESEISTITYKDECDDKLEKDIHVAQLKS